MMIRITLGVLLAAFLTAILAGVPAIVAVVLIAGCCLIAPALYGITMEISKRLPEETMGHGPDIPQPGLKGDDTPTYVTHKH